MHRYAILLIFTASIFTSLLVGNGVHAEAFNEKHIRIQSVDEEYDRYKKRGDAYFDQGEYLNALQQYRNCLEVPNFEDDPYAKARIALCQKLLNLREQANKSLENGKSEDAVGTFEQMLIENPRDSITKANLTEYWTEEGTKLYNQKKYEEAKIRYQKALQYATRSEMINLQIQNSEMFIKLRKDQAASDDKTGTTKIVEQPANQGLNVPLPTAPPLSPPKPKRRIAAKILTAAVGAGAGAYAYTLHNNYQSKLNEVNRIGKSVDPDGDNVVLTPGEFNQWQTAYKATTDAKNERTKFMAALGVAGAAAVTEIILFVLPKARKPTGISVGAATQSSGLALRYIFK